MFIFNKKQKKINIVKFIYNTISLQLNMIETPNNNIKNIVIKNPFLLGYFLGYCDSCIQNSVFCDIKKNKEHWEDIIITTYILFFGEDTGEELFKYSYSIINNDIDNFELWGNFMNANIIGGTDYLEGLKNKVPPLGLFNLIVDLKNDI